MSIQQFLIFVVTREKFNRKQILNIILERIHESKVICSHELKAILMINSNHSQLFLAQDSYQFPPEGLGKDNVCLLLPVFRK